MDMNIVLYKALMNNGCALQVICTYTQTSYVLVQYEYIYLYKYMLVPTIHGGWLHWASRNAKLQSMIALPDDTVGLCRTPRSTQQVFNVDMWCHQKYEHVAISLCTYVYTQYSLSRAICWTPFRQKLPYAWTILGTATYWYLTFDFW